MAIHTSVSDVALYIAAACCPADAVVRGHRSGLLTAADYNNLAQCESLDDIKLNLVRTLRAAVRPAVPFTGGPGGLAPLRKVCSLSCCSR